MAKASEVDAFLHYDEYGTTPAPYYFLYALAAVTKSITPTQRIPIRWIKWICHTHLRVNACPFHALPVECRRLSTNNPSSARTRLCEPVELATWLYSLYSIRTLCVIISHIAAPSANTWQLSMYFATKQRVVEAKKKCPRSLGPTHLARMRTDCWVLSHTCILYSVQCIYVWILEVCVLFDDIELYIVYL